MTPRAGLLVVVGLLALGTIALHEKRRTLRAELATLSRAGHDVSEATVDARVSTEIDRMRLALERARSASPRSAQPHLALEVGEGLLTLERGDIVLRAVEVRSTVSRGVRRIARVDADAILLDDGVELRVEGTNDPGRPSARTILLRRADFDAIRPNVGPGRSLFSF